MLTVSMTVSHLYQNLKTLKVSEALNRLLKVLIIAINAQSHSVDAPSPPPGLGVEITCVHTPYGRKLIGSLVPKASDTFNVFQVLIKMADSHRHCQHH